MLLPIVKITNLNDLLGDEFIGYFISYENIEITSIPVISLDCNQVDNKLYKYTNSNILYNNSTNLVGKILSAGFSINKRTEEDKNNDEVDISNINVYIKSYLEKHLDISTNKSFIYELFNTPNAENSDYNTIIKITKNILYNSKYKTLFRLTKNIYEDTLREDTFMYLPGFYNREKVISYDQELIFSPTGDYVYKSNNVVLSANYKIYANTKYNFSHICLNALSIKQDYTYNAAVKQSGGIVNNKFLSPDKVSDFLELKEDYQSKPVISYTNYNDNYQDVFDKTIYRSDVISDESLNNGFKHFAIENYKNILENKGNIVNIIGVGLYLLVHTEYSLFVFDRNSQLNKDVQLQIPDVFDIDYKELTPSGEGFGGLKYKDESILTKNGYIWFDRVSKSIFMFTGQDIKPLSADIHRLLKNYFETENNYQIRFAEDYYSNRLIITIRDASSYITLSYSFDSNTFISAHDYTFDKNYKTYNNSYIFSEKHPTKLFVYDKKSVDYKNLDIGRRSILTKLVTTGTTQLNSYIDIIFTDKYELPKVLNSISYVMSRNNKYEPYTNVIDQYFNTNYEREPHQNKEKLYSGYQIAIATDLTFSGTLSLDKTAEVNSLNNYRRPHWNQGIWNFNWFRENLPKNVTEGELEQQNVNNQMKEVYEQHDDLYPLSGLEKSDMRSAIIGKYFILRFIFERKQEDLNLKFETVDVNISKL